VVLRWRVQGALLAQADAPGQQSLQFADAPAGATLREYAVLVTNTAHTPEALGQPYRDRADYENGFDDLKNQWGRLTKGLAMKACLNDKAIDC
jgi:hypothetical protein